MPGMLPVPFPMEYEVHDVDDFQDKGHFVCGLKDANGFRRAWQGTEVHVLTLRCNIGTMREQMLRVMADSVPEVARLMCMAVTESLFSGWMAQSAAGFTHSQFVELNERRNQFVGFVNAQYAWEIEHGEHQRFADVFDVAVYYMRKERSRWRRRLLRMIRREKPANAGEWVPSEWRA